MKSGGYHERFVTHERRVKREDDHTRERGEQEGQSRPHRQHTCFASIVKP